MTRASTLPMQTDDTLVIAVLERIREAEGLSLRATRHFSLRPRRSHGADSPAKALKTLHDASART